LDLPVLKSKLREHGKTYAYLANVIGRSVTTANAKINGRVAFSVTKAYLIFQWLNFTDEEKAKIFLT
jgi:hypothetical protein